MAVDLVVYFVHGAGDSPWTPKYTGETGGTNDVVTTKTDLGLGDGVGRHGN
jgi:hypothetical protein